MVYLSKIIIIAYTLLSIAGFTVKAEEILLIDDFRNDRRVNLLNSQTGPWEMDPQDESEWACCQAVTTERDGQETRALKIEYKVFPGAFNGYFTKLNGVDGRSYERLEFYVKGGERFPRRFKLELKNKAGETGNYYVSSISEDWEKYSVPFYQFRGLRDLSGLDELVIVFEGNVVGEPEGSIYIDNLKLSGSRERHIKVSQKIQDEQLKKRGEIDTLLAMGEDDLLETISKKVFNYFWEETDPQTGFIRDRSRTNVPSSIAATGFGLAAISIGVHRGWVDYDRARERVIKTLKNIKNKAEGHKGYFYHFIDMRTGKRAWQCELSSVDTALLFGGIIVAREYFECNEITELADELYYAVEWPFMVEPNTKGVYMGWDPENGFDEYILWDMYGEQMLMYILGLGSPTHPFPQETWHSFRRPVKLYDDIAYIYCESESLFVYLFSHAFIDFRDKHDDYADYWVNNKNAVKAHIAFCRNNPLGFEVFEKGLWGISASDGPDGYRNYGATVFTTDGTIAPYSVPGSYPFVPEEALSTIRLMVDLYGENIWDANRYGFVSAFNPERNWYSGEFIGIDLGIMLLMMENYRSEFIWDHFMRNEYVQRGMEKAGFREGTKEIEYDPADMEQIGLDRRSYTARRIDSHQELTEDDFTSMDDTMFEFGKTDYRGDLQAEFALGWNPEYLFVTANVKTDIVIADMPPNRIYQHDSVEIFISPNEFLTWAYPTHFQIGFSPSGPDNVPQVYSYFQNEIPENYVTVESEITDRGYIINAAVQWEYLRINPEARNTIGFSLAVHDMERPRRDGAGGAKLNWAFSQTPAGILLGELILQQ